jgi:hypothetical protein
MKTIDLTNLSEVKCPNPNCNYRWVSPTRPVEEPNVLTKIQEFECADERCGKKFKLVYTATKMIIED